MENEDFNQDLKIDDKPFTLSEKKQFQEVISNFSLAQLNDAKQIIDQRIEDLKYRIQNAVMNNPINSNYLPVLQEISSESFLFFGEDKTNTINFTYFDNTFVVDGIYSHLRLISKNGEEKQSADVVRLES